MKNANFWDIKIVLAQKLLRGKYSDPKKHDVQQQQN